MLFEEDYGGENTDPSNDPEITQVIFYYGKEEAVLFKRLAREGMKKEFANYIEDGNISDLLMKLLKENYGHLLPETANEAGASGIVESEVRD